MASRSPELNSLDNSPGASIPVGLATKGPRPAGVKVVMDGVILKLETGLSGEIEDGVVFLDNLHYCSTGGNPNPLPRVSGGAGKAEDAWAFSATTPTLGSRTKLGSSIPLSSARPSLLLHPGFIGNKKSGIVYELVNGILEDLKMIC